MHGVRRAIVLLAFLSSNSVSRAKKHHDKAKQLEIAGLTRDMEARDAKIKELQIEISALKAKASIGTALVSSPSDSPHLTSSLATVAPRVMPQKKLSGVKKTITVAVAADERYMFKAIANVEHLRTLKAGKSYRIIGYDLGGLSDESKSQLRCAAPRLLDELRDFDFSSYAFHVRDLHCYAWKPLILASLRREFPSEGLVWLDSGVLLLDGRNFFLERAVAVAAAQGGVMSDKTRGPMKRWVHNAMFDYFERTYGFKKEYFLGAKDEVNNCNGAFSAWAPLDADKQWQRSAKQRDHELLQEAVETASPGTRAIAMWEECASHKECMCPAGSDRGNHRQDQAALTLILATLDLRCYDNADPGPYGNASKWVSAHGLRMQYIKCQSVQCFVNAHAEQWAPPEKKAQGEGGGRGGV